MHLKVDLTPGSVEAWGGFCLRTSLPACDRVRVKAGPCPPGSSPCPNRLGEWRCYRVICAFLPALHAVQGHWFQETQGVCVVCVGGTLCLFCAPYGPMLDGPWPLSPSPLPPSPHSSLLTDMVRSLRHSAITTTLSRPRTWRLASGSPLLILTLHWR